MRRWLRVCVLRDFNEYGRHGVWFYILCVWGLACMNLQKLVNNGCAKYFAARASNAEGVSPIPLRARVLV